MTKCLLVSFKTCPWVQRAAIVLRERNAPFEFRHIEPDNRPDWFLAISPHKKVPVLRVDDTVSLFESNAIAEYLDETIAPRLHPEDPVARAVNRAWTDYVPSFAEAVTAIAYADTEADYRKAAEKIPVPFERLERALEKQGSGPYFNGAEPHGVSRMVDIGIAGPGMQQDGQPITVEHQPGQECRQQSRREGDLIHRLRVRSDQSVMPAPDPGLRKCRRDALAQQCGPI